MCPSTMNITIEAYSIILLGEETADNDHVSVIIQGF